MRGPDPTSDLRANERRLCPLGPPLLPWENHVGRGQPWTAMDRLCDY